MLLLKVGVEEGEEGEDDFLSIFCRLYSSLSAFRLSRAALISSGLRFELGLLGLGGDEEKRRAGQQTVQTFIFRPNFLDPCCRTAERNVYAKALENETIRHAKNTKYVLWFICLASQVLHGTPEKKN